HPFNLLLLVLGIVALVTDDDETFLTMCIMIAIAMGLRLFQEYRSAKKIESLRKKNLHYVRIRRPIAQIAEKNYQIVTASVDQLVPGDIVELPMGSIIPAVLRILEAYHVMINQSILTGESFPVEKFPQSQVADN